MRHFQILLFSIHSLFIAYIAAPLVLFLILSLWSIQYDHNMAELGAGYWRKNFALLMTTAPVAKTFFSLIALIVFLYWRKGLIIQLCFWGLLLLVGGIYFFQELQQMGGKIYTAGLFRSTAFILSVMTAIIVLFTAGLSERLLHLQFNFPDYTKTQRLRWMRTKIFTMAIVTTLCVSLLILKLLFYITWMQAGGLGLFIFVSVVSLQIMIQIVANWRSRGRPWVEWHCWMMIALIGGVMTATAPIDNVWPYLTGGGFFLLIGFIASLIYALSWLKVHNELQERL